MQHCQPNRPGGVADLVPPRPIDNYSEGRHHGLLLIGSRGAGRLTTPVSRRVLDRLLAPRAQVEGVDFHLSDPLLSVLAGQARAFALVLPPLGNLSTPYYAVHPRRNDRFVTARAPLRSLFPEVDFAPLAFTGHALGTLAATCPVRFAAVRTVIVQEWRLRMQALLSCLPSEGVLIDLPTPPWLTRPPIPGERRRRLALDPDDRVAGAANLRAALVTRCA